MDLSRLLNYYEKKIGQEIAPDDYFLLKYNTNKKSSVFQKEDFEALKNDIITFAKIDFNEKTIAPGELLQLYNSKVDNEHKEYGLSNFYIKFTDKIYKFEKAQKKETKTESPIEQLIKEEKELEQIDNEKIKKYTENEKFKNVIGKYDIETINELDEAQIKRFDYFLENLPDKIFNEGLMGIAMLAKLANEKDLTFIKNLVEMGLPIDACLVIFNEHNNFEGKNDILKKLTDKLFKDFQNDETLNKNDNPLNTKSDYLIELFLEPETTKNLSKFYNRFEEQVTAKNLSQILNICSEKDINFDRILELLENRKLEDIIEHRAITISKLNDEDFKKAKVLFANPEYDRLSIQPLLNLTPEKIELIKNIINDIPESDFSYWSTEDFCNLNTDELERFKTISKIKLANNPIDTEIALRLINQPEKVIEKIKSYKNIPENLNQKLIIFMAMADDTILDKFIQEHPKYKYDLDEKKQVLTITKPETFGQKEPDKIPTPAKILKQTSKVPESNEETMLRYNLNTKSFETVNSLLETHSSSKTVANTQESRLQNIEYTRIPTGYTDFKDGRIVTNQEIKTFDKNNHLILTEKYELSNATGIANITETDANGVKRTLQKSTIDKHGNLQITKDFSSPDNTRTQQQYLEDEIGNKRSVYKITDANGNILFDRTQSISIISENKYISTRNGRSFEVEFNEKEIIITNPTNKKATTIPLDTLIKKDDKDTIVKLLKGMSAEQLILLKLGDIKSIELYSSEVMDGTYVNNAYWNAIEKRIFLGDTTYTNTQKKFLQRNAGVLAHEYGHFIDWVAKDIKGEQISARTSISRVKKEELKNFLTKATSEEEEFIDYFTGSSEGLARGAEETLAESNTIINSNSDRAHSIRAYYLQRNFPHTICSNAKAVENLEELALKKFGLI